MSITVAVNGAAGKMGKQVCLAVIEDKDLSLIACCDTNPDAADQNLREIIGQPCPDIICKNDMKDILTLRPDVMVDFTHPDSVFENVKTSLGYGVHTVVGTTGLNTDEIGELRDVARKNDANILVAPNFAIGAVLMIELSIIAAKYMDSCEIIELHHPGKADAPSGTAIKTAESLSKDHAVPRLKEGERESLQGARGAALNGIHIHSIRLPGLVAHQEVVFGDIGQTLTIRHDSMNRESFMPGVIMAIKAVPKRPGLTYGLENLLDT